MRDDVFWTLTEEAIHHLVTEDLDLRVGPVKGLVAAVVVTVCVNLDHQRETLDPFLGGEVCTQTVDCDEDLQKRDTELKLVFTCKTHFKSKVYVHLKEKKHISC